MGWFGITRSIHISFSYLTVQYGPGNPRLPIRAVALKVWSLDQQYQLLLKPFTELRLSGSTLYLLCQKPRGWSPGMLSQARKVIPVYSKV